MTVATGCRHRLTDEQLRILWARWKEGDSLVVIAEALAIQLSSLYGVVKRAGGIAPRARTRAKRVLTTGEREGISRGLAAGHSIRTMARALGRAPSTISREITRHGGRTHYRAAEADRAAWQRAQRPQPCRLARLGRLRAVVARKLRAKWAPQQIAGWLVVEYPDDPSMHISHETIYRSLYVQARGVLKKELVAHLRRRRLLRRRPQGAAPRRGGRIADAVSIAERPATAADRAVPGHWEGDLLAGSGNSYVATLVERQSRYVLLIRVRGKDTTTVVGALAKRVRRLPDGLMASLTWDRGTELAAHKRFTMATDVQVYFCDPQSPWQRGSNENTNGLLRQYLPHGTNLTQFSQRQLDAVARQLNTRPRATLGFQTPAAILAASVAPTH